MSCICDMHESGLIKSETKCDDGGFFCVVLFCFMAARTLSNQMRSPSHSPEAEVLAKGSLNLCFKIHKICDIKCTIKHA